MYAAVWASDTAASDVQGARKLRRASYIVSCVGIIVTVIVAAVVVGVYFSIFCRYNGPNGACFHYFSSNMTPEECSAKGGDYVAHVGCYYN